MTDETNGLFLGFSDLLQSELQKSRDEVASQGEGFLGDLLHVRTACKACIGSIPSRPDRAFPTEDLQQKLRRANVHSAIVQGIHFVEYAIEFGGYAQAAALVRQEIDGVIVARGIRLGEHTDKKGPQWASMPTFKNLNGMLSGLTHLSDHKILSTKISDSIGNVDHNFNPEFARQLFGLHVCALIFLILDMIEFREPYDDNLLNDEEEWWLNSAIGVMVHEGLLPPGD